MNAPTGLSEPYDPPRAGHGSGHTPDRTACGEMSQVQCESGVWPRGATPRTRLEVRARVSLRTLTGGWSSRPG